MGWKTGDMLNGIDGIMALSASDGLDLASTCDIVTDALTGFGLKAEDSGHFADVLASASSNANTNVSMLGESFKYVAPLAGAFKFSAEDTSIALGLMANAGIKASQSGTSLKTALSNMASPTDAMKKAMDNYNLSITNTDGSMKSLKEVMDMLRNNLGSLSEAEQASAASTIFGKEAMAGMLSIINASEEDYNKLTEAIYNCDGAAENMSETMQDNLSGQLTLLKSQLEGVAIQLGEVLIPHIRAFVTKISEWVDKFANLNPEIQEFILKASLIASVIGPVLLVTGKLIQSFVSLKVAFGVVTKFVGEAGGMFGLLSKAIAGLTSPLGLVALAVGAFVVAVSTNFMGLRDSLVNLIEGLKNVFSIGLEFIKGLWESNFLGIQDIVSSAIETIKSIVEGFTQIFVDLINIIADILNGDWSKLWEDIKNLVSDTFGAIGDIISNSFDLIVNLFKAGIQIILAPFKLIFDVISAGLKALWDFVSNWFVELVSNIGNWLSGAWDSVSNWFSGLVSSVTTWLGEVWNSITDWFNSVVEGVQYFLENWDTIIMDWFKNLAYEIGYELGEMLSTIKQWGENIKTFFFETIPQLIEDIKQWCLEALEVIKQWGENVKTFIFETIPNVVHSVCDWFKEMYEGIKTWVSNAYESIKEWCINTYNTTVERISSTVRAVIDWFKNLPEGIKAWLHNAYNVLSNWCSDIYNKGREGASNTFNAIIDGFKGLPGHIKDIGLNAIHSFWEGFKGGIAWVKNKVSGFIGEIKDSFTSGFSAGSADGSHFNGLDYVPYDGYTARLHKGERVLTAEENRQLIQSRNVAGGEPQTFIINNSLALDGEVVATSTNRILGNRSSLNSRGLAL